MFRVACNLIPLQAISAQNTSFPSFFLSFIYFLNDLQSEIFHYFFSLGKISTLILKALYCAIGFNFKRTYGYYFEFLIVDKMQKFCYRNPRVVKIDPKLTRVLLKKSLNILSLILNLFSDQKKIGNS